MQSSVTSPSFFGAFARFSLRTRYDGPRISKGGAMAERLKPDLKKFSFGGCDFGATSPALEELTANTPNLNITVSFEEALKLHLAIGECIRKLNSYRRSTKRGKRTALNLNIHLGKGRLNRGRITVNETTRQRKSSQQ
jgi:hypothetical protein